MWQGLLRRYPNLQASCSCGRIDDTDRVGRVWESEVETRASPWNCGDGRANLDCFLIFICPGAVTILISTHLISLTAVLPNPTEFLITYSIVPASLPPAILSPIAAIGMVVIVAVFGIVGVILMM
jgi:hypothetical protein